MLITFSTSDHKVAVHLHEGDAHFVEFTSGTSGRISLHPAVEGLHKVKSLVLDSITTSSFERGHSDSARAIVIFGWEECVRQAKAKNTHLL